MKVVQHRAEGKGERIFTDSWDWVQKTDIVQQAVSFSTEAPAFDSSETYIMYMCSHYL